jgi:hypothetical protein
MQLVSSLQQPVDVLYRSATRINPQDGAPPFGVIQFQHRFGGFYQRSQGFRQRLVAGEDLLHHHFLIPSGQHVSDLTPPTVALSAEIAGGGEGRLGPTRPSGDVNIQNLPLPIVRMAVSPAVLAVNDGQGFLHLLHVL